MSNISNKIIEPTLAGFKEKGIKLPSHINNKMDTRSNIQGADLKGGSTGSVDESNTFDLDALDPETRQRVEEELKVELAKTEEEIQTLRQVLAARIKHSHDLKRKLGIGVWKELTSDLQAGIKNVQETTA